MSVWNHYYDTIYYIMIRYFGFKENDFITHKLSDIGLLLLKYNDEKEERDIWELQLRGINPKDVPRLRDRIIRDERMMGDKKVKLDKEDAKTYGKLFQSVLKNGKR